MMLPVLLLLFSLLFPRSHKRKHVDGIIGLVKLTYLWNVDMHDFILYVLIASHDKFSLLIDNPLFQQLFATWGIVDQKMCVHVDM